MRRFVILDGSNAIHTFNGCAFRIVQRSMVIQIILIRRQSEAVRCAIRFCKSSINRMCRFWNINISVAASDCCCVSFRCVRHCHRGHWQTDKLVHVLHIVELGNIPQFANLVVSIRISVQLETCKIGWIVVCLCDSETCV